MKKHLSILFVILLVFLVACGNDKTNQPEEDENHPDDGKTSAEIQEEIMTEQEDISEEKAEVEVLDIKYYKWIDESVDEETITVYAAIKNTSNTSIDAGMVNVTYLDSNGSVISVNESQISPRFLNEGSTGYVSTEIEDDIDMFDDLDEVEVEVSPEPFQDAEIVEFTTKDEKLNVGTWGEDNSKTSVTGFLKNESDTNFAEDDTSAVIGLYDEDDNFIAAESMYQDQGFSIDANDETSFDIAGGSPLPPEIGEKVDRAEVKAIGIENMDDYWW